MLGGISFAEGMTMQDPNNVEDLPAAEIIERALDATRGADSLRIRGEGTSGVQLRLDLAMNAQGDCTGTIGLGGGTANVIRADDVSYLQADEDYWKAADVDSDTATQYADQWLKLSAEIEEAEGLAELCNWDSLLGYVPSGSGMTKGKVHRINGMSAVPVTKKDGAVTVKVEVATEGEPYILQLTETGSDEPGDLAFKDYNKPVNVKVPDAEDVIDLETRPGQ
jgi:hypothetical protein